MNLKNKRSLTKIICTIGPASVDRKILKEMVTKGMSVARLNFSHGSYSDKRRAISLIHSVSEELGIHVAILADLSGPKIRMGNLKHPVEVKRNTVVEIGIGKKTERELFTDFKDLAGLLKTGDRVLVDDGMIEMKVLSVESGFFRAKVMNSGVIRSHKGINLPDVSFRIRVFTKKDRDDLKFALEEGVDLVAMSFVDSPENVIPLRKMMKKMKIIRPVIAKIERPQALKNLERIIEEFDGVMVARGDLGVEVPLEDVPFIQKRLIRMATEKKKLVITATQMLDSMIRNPMPTRAEVTDVTNAILEGSDLVMLSGETAVGNFPVKAVNTMRKIALTTERSPLYRYAPEDTPPGDGFNEVIAKGAAEIALDLKADSIVVFSFSGATALLLSKFRPPCPVYAFSPDPDVVSRMASFWGIIPVYVEFSSHTDEMIIKAESILKKKKLIRKGDTIVTVAGETPMKGATNMIKLLVVK